MIGDLSDKVYDVLEKSAVRREFIQVDQYLRGVGKTHALVKLAKKFDLYIVTPFEGQSRYIERAFSYKKVVTQDQLAKIRGKREVYLIFDEGVEPSKLRGFNVITGFLSDN